MSVESLPVVGARPEARPSWFEDEFARWKAFLEGSRLAERTVRLYTYQLLRFLADVAIDPRRVDEDDITRYLASQKGPMAQSLLRAIKSYYGWAVRRGVHPENPAAEVKFPRQKHPPVYALTADELQRALIAAAWRDERRAWAIILTLETGGRIGSVAGLEPEDVPTEPGQLVRFRVTKGDRPYVVPLSPLGAMAARELHARRNGHRTLLGVHRNTIWHWWHQAARDACLAPRKQRAHILRDTFATNLLMGRGVDVRTVQELLNHSDLSQMSRYTQVTDRRKRTALSQSIALSFDPGE